jgi:hypothetical protein
MKINLGVSPGGFASSIYPHPMSGGGKGVEPVTDVGTGIDFD